MGLILLGIVMSVAVARRMFRACFHGSDMAIHGRTPLARRLRDPRLQAFVEESEGSRYGGKEGGTR
jgi:hypothetical protein